MTVRADSDPLSAIPFTRRIDNFRAWFIANEPAIANGARQAAKDPAASEELTSFVSQGTALLAENVFFIVGGREFTFSTEGRACLFFLHPRLVAALRCPELAHWTFHPWLQGSGGGVFELDIFGVKLDTDSVLVGIEESGEAGDGAAVDLRFFSPALAEFEEVQAVRAFYVLLDNAIGEGLVYRCVASVRRVRNMDAEREGEPEAGMAPLTQLEARLAARLQKDGGGGAAPAADPAGRFFSYTREVEEKEDTLDLRDDISTGVTRYMPLVNDHYAASPETWRAFAAFGAKPGFLYYYPDPEMDAKALLDQRYDLQDRIESEVLGTAGAGSELGLVMGGAVGQERVYIDLLLYDWDAARERLVRFVADFHRLVFLSEFRPGGDVTMLFDSSTPDLFKKLTDLHDAGCCGETALVITALPPAERGYEVQSLLGRALNNLDRHDEALDVLESIRRQGESDPVWHFRVGYALYYLDREAEAAPHFQHAIDLGQDDERTREFLQDCRAYIEGDMNSAPEQTS